MKPKIDGRSTRHSRDRRKVYGVGINDANYNTQPVVDGKKVWCKYARTWKDMLERAYSSKFHEKYPSYIGTTVCDEWHTFSIFKSWMQDQDWEGKQLDKDLLGDGYMYSPEFCRFISSHANSVLSLGTREINRKLPIGVCEHQGKYRAYCRNKGTLVHLGVFDDIKKAHASWQLYKRSQIIQLAQGEKLPEIVGALNSIANKLCQDFAFGLYTESWR